MRSKAALTKINDWIKTKTGGDPTKIVDGYRLNGDNIGTTGTMAFVAPFGAIAVFDAGNQAWLDAHLEADGRRPHHQPERRHRQRAGHADGDRQLVAALAACPLPGFPIPDPDAPPAGRRPSGGPRGWPGNCLGFALTVMLQELRHSLRTLRRSPGFSATAILMLALGSGTTTAIFSIAYGVMLRDLPYQQPDRLVALRMTEPRVGSALANVGAADYFDWRRRQQVFEDIALTRPVGSFNLTGAGEPERLQGARTTASLFSVLRAAPLIGRTFTEAEQLDPARAARRGGAQPRVVAAAVRGGSVDRRADHPAGGPARTRSWA